MTTEQIIPEWCNKYIHKDWNKDNKICCCCGNYGIAYQERNKKVLHSLCSKCYVLLKKFRGEGK